MILLDKLRENCITVSADCGGHRTCGKCKVLCSDLPITQRDKELLPMEELERGVRLACSAVVDDDFDISKVAIWGNSSIRSLSTDKTDTITINNSIEFGFAVDIGTTTVATALVDLSEGSVIDSYTITNPQRSFGADVLSRIKASNDGYGKKLNELIINGLDGMFELLLHRNNILPTSIKRIVIAGNTTMIHLLMAYPLTSMGSFPFEPYSTRGVLTRFHNIFGYSKIDADVYIIPMISAFIGGDITAGILYSNLLSKSDVSLFVDLGTNGEIVIGNKEGLAATSTAAGPAFEGGNISIGVPSVDGAIFDTYIIGRNKLGTKTIGGRTPIGICGSGLVSIISDLFQTGILSNDGLLSDDYFNDGFSVYNKMALKQDDIREFQLAKSAIRTGIELLCNNYGINSNEIDNIILAGGFGNCLDAEKAKKIGLIPDCDADIVSVGNSSLNGAIQVLRDEGSIKMFDRVVEKTNTIIIAEDEMFNDLYLKYMSFGI